MNTTGLYSGEVSKLHVRPTTSTTSYCEDRDDPPGVMLSTAPSGPKTDEYFDDV